jgi:hypothetical protein
MIGPSAIWSLNTDIEGWVGFASPLEDLEAPLIRVPDGRPSIPAAEEPKAAFEDE